MVLFNGAHGFELVSQILEAFFFSGFCEFLVHFSPFVVFAGCCILQVFHRIRDGATMESLEPDLGMFLFVAGSFQEVLGYPFVPFLLCYTGIIPVFIVSLGFTCKRSP